MTDKLRTQVFGEGRDAGKTFHVEEVPPLDMAGFMLRLASSLRVPSYETLIDELLALKGALPAALPPGQKRSAKDKADEAATSAGAAVDVIMQLIQRCDATALHALIKEALTYVKISPDPQHPGAERALMSDDIREKTTLLAVLVAFAKLNAWDGA